MGVSVRLTSPARSARSSLARSSFWEKPTQHKRRTGWVQSTRSFPTPNLRRVALEWAAKVNAKSPTSQRMLKYTFNLVDDGLVGQQLFAGEATRLALHVRRARWKAATPSWRSGRRIGARSRATSSNGCFEPPLSAHGQLARPMLVVPTSERQPGRQLSARPITTHRLSLGGGHIAYRPAGGVRSQDATG